MSSSIKRSLNDLTNENKRLKNDSTFAIGELKTNNSQSLYSTSVSSESLIDDDDDVFEEEQSVMISLSKNSQS